MLFNYQLKIADHYEIPTGKFKKLVPYLFDKQNYVILHENFQLHLRLELKLKIYTLY